MAKLRKDHPGHRRKGRKNWHIMNPGYPTGMFFQLFSPTGKLLVYNSTMGKYGSIRIFVESE
ncbi:hypothetical protein HMPREF3213_01205 [Heyndrickxia coagulans]|uniref:Uncharacterized protein n=1 Tax=Heyndrickxia coagulans TaxID=1398 RepID=A0A133KUU7_HEYCO|nr:hypothetical protein HMPREF3213_01205 [Heyndrickxia coagulans]